MLRVKISTIMIVFLMLFILSDFIAYRYIIHSLKDSHNKNEQIVFSELQRKTNKLLTHILYKYELRKNVLEDKHKEVLEYFTKNEYDIPLKEIYEKINKEENHKPFNIYITDDNLKIVNTTFSPDLGFDLSFAKNTFEEHKKKNIIGISAPVFETYSTEFFSFSDSYLPNSNRILQVSYKYPNTKKYLKEIQNLIDQNNMIVKSEAYLIFKDGYIGDFVFKAFEPSKKTLEEIKKRLEDGKLLSKRVKEKDIVIENINEDGINYKVFYFSQSSVIFDDAKVVYQVVFNQEDLNSKIKTLNIIIFLLSIIAIFTIIALFRIRYQEVLLTQKDMFIRHSVHEIKTPLSIISLNNQLRDKKVGEDKYSIKINSAIKTLTNSYDDMNYLLTKNKIIYDIVRIDLAIFLKQRVEYFKSIALSQARNIKLDVEKSFFIDISEIELTRLIDNNLSNAIKYSEINSLIEVKLENNTLIFISVGNEIKDKKLIFEKYKRENMAIGGNGLGLSIVSDITKKYNIKIELKRENNKNIFIYKFN